MPVMDSIHSIDGARIAEFGVWFLVFLFSSTLHEAAHALLARLGGDDTAYEGGQVSLSPLPHIRREPFGMILVPILSFFYMGWLMGWASTPYDPDWARRHPGRQALMSAAGPAANFILALLAGAALMWLMAAGVLVPPEALAYAHLAEPAPRYGPDTLLNPLSAVLSVGLSLNVLLFVLNLIPLPPMDGSGVLHGLFPGSLGRLLDSLRGNPAMSLLGLGVAWLIFPHVFRPIFGIVLTLLYSGTFGL